MMSGAAARDQHNAVTNVCNRTIRDRLFETSEGVAVPRRKDRRVERTQQLIRGAMLSLIREKGFEALTVQQIIDRANVGRATFYAHFDNKDDLLTSGFEDLRASLKAHQQDALSRRSSFEERVFAFSQDVFAHTNEYRDVFRAMVGKRSGATVQRLLHKLLVDLVRDDVKATVVRTESAIPNEALVQFIAGALFGLLMWWLGGRTRLSVAEVNALFRRLAIPALKSATR
jgi:AcrR family transcriptional regulator